MPTRCYEANARHAVQYVIRGGAHRSPRLVGAPLYCAWCARGAVLGQQPLDSLHSPLGNARVLFPRNRPNTLRCRPPLYLCTYMRVSPRGSLARAVGVSAAARATLISYMSAAVGVGADSGRSCTSSPGNVRVGSAALAASAISAGMIGLAG